VPKVGEAFVAVVVVAAAVTMSDWLLSLLLANPAAALYTARIVYEAAAAPPGRTNVAPAAPLVTVPDVTGPPIKVDPLLIVKVTVPAFTAP
jgi:hypothetical protein